MNQHPDVFDAQFLEAIADRTRLRILTALEQSPATAADLAASTGISAENLADQLRLLTDRDLIVADGDLYRTRSTGWIKLTELLRDVGPRT